MREPMDLTGLGLPRVQAALLGGIAEQGVSTAVHLSGRLGLSAEAVSRGLTALCDAGLAMRGEGRPRPVSLDPLWREHILRLRGELVHTQRRQRAAFDQATVRLEGTAAATATPHTIERSLVPTRPVPSNAHLDLHPMLRTWSEITTGASVVLQTRGWLGRAQRTGVAVRLLLTGPPPAAKVLTGAAETGAQIRLTEELLTPLLIVDGTRARVLLSVSRSSRHGWTTDPGQLRLLEDGFDAAWRRAEPAGTSARAA